jgi:hypothetical protein
MIFWHRQLRWDSFSPIIRQIWPIYAANKDTYHQQSAELSDVYRPLLPMIETGTKILQCSRPSTQLIPFPPKNLKQFQSFFRPSSINTSPPLQAACGLRVTCDSPCNPGTLRLPTIHLRYNPLAPSTSPLLVSFADFHDVCIYSAGYPIQI